jgi:hypothetical protein
VKASTSDALKEWAVVARALREGTQIFLLRKGGLVEDGGSFRMQESEFVFYPTFEHQDAADLAERFRDWPADSLRTRESEATIDFDVCAAADDVIDVTDAAKLLRLLPHTIWSESFLKKRLAYKPELPLKLVFARCFRSPRPVRRPVEAEYAGCTSWVKLAVPVETGGFYPVLSADVYNDRKRKVLDALNA